MKRNRKLIGLICAITIMVMMIGVWWNASRPLINIDPSNVSKIEIFNGRTGEAMTILDPSDIEHIIENLNTVSIKKEKVSLGYLGTYLRTTIYEADNVVYKEFIINSNYTIRKDPFFYKDTSESIDYNYIQELMDHTAK